MNVYIHHWFHGEKGSIHQNATGAWIYDSASNGVIADIVHKWDVVVDGKEEAVGLASLQEAEKVARSAGVTKYWNGQHHIAL